MRHSAGESKKFSLEKSGRSPHILVTNDGEEALEMFRDYNQTRDEAPASFPPIVILLDINMPRMDGFEFLEGLEELTKESAWLSPDVASVVRMLTSSDDPYDRARSEGLFPLVQDYLTKPPSTEDAIPIADRFGEEQA